MSKTVQRFNIIDYHSVSAKPAVLENRASKEKEPSVSASFESICEEFFKEMEMEFTKKAETKEGQELVDNEQLAIWGQSQNVSILLEKIDSFISKQSYRNVQIPEYYQGIRHYAPMEHQKYSDLAHAIFHELYGLNRLAVWTKYPDSYALQVIGQTIWIYRPDMGRHVRMPFTIPNAFVQKIIRSLESQKRDKVNEHNPTLEVDLYTGERVSILVEPFVKQTVITFRRVTMEAPTLAFLSTKGMFPKETTPLLIGISKTHCNTVIAGPMGTGKTTLLKAMVAERDDHVTGVSIEKEYEIGVSRDHPNKKFIEIITRNISFEEAMEKALRTDADYGIIQEVRMVEAEGAMLMCERLQKGFLSTTHIWRPETLPQQWARMICKVNGGGDPKEEEKRVAEYIDLIIVLEQDETKTEKRIQSIQEIRFNRENGEISTHQIMRRNPETCRYEYRCDLSPQLVREMKMINSSWTHVVIDTLSHLEQQSPIPEGEGVTVFNPAIADPQLRVALTLEQLVNVQKETARLMAQITERLDRLERSVGSGAI